MKEQLTTTQKQNKIYIYIYIYIYITILSDILAILHDSFTEL